MAVSVDTVYQKVLAFANKEQRGYITPQEFNLFADQAQMEIFEQYFYDINQFGRVPRNDTEYSDMLTNLEEKITIFKERSVGIPAFNKWGDVSLPSDLYRLGTVRANNWKGAEEMKSGAETFIYRESKLTEPTLLRPFFERLKDNVIKFWPYDAVPKNEWAYINYIRKPLKPNWGYVVVNDKPLYNSTVSTDFELHLSEESELVYRILTFAGIAIEKPQLTQVAVGLETAKIQQEKL